MYINLLIISSESLISEERMLPRCILIVLEKPRGEPQNTILECVDEPAA